MKKEYKYLSYVIMVGFVGFILCSNVLAVKAPYSGCYGCGNSVGIITRYFQAGDELGSNCSSSRDTKNSCFRSGSAPSNGFTYVSGKKLCKTAYLKYGVESKISDLLSESCGISDISNIDYAFSQNNSCFETNDNTVSGTSAKLNYSISEKSEECGSLLHVRYNYSNDYNYSEVFIPIVISKVDNNVYTETSVTKNACYACTLSGSFENKVEYYWTNNTALLEQRCLDIQEASSYTTSTACSKANGSSSTISFSTVPSIVTTPTVITSCVKCSDGSYKEGSSNCSNSTSGFKKVSESYCKNTFTADNGSLEDGVCNEYKICKRNSDVTINEYDGSGTFKNINYSAVDNCAAVDQIFDAFCLDPSQVGPDVIVNSDTCDNSSATWNYKKDQYIDMNSTFGKALYYLYKDYYLNGATSMQVDTVARYLWFDAIGRGEFQDFADESATYNVTKKDIYKTKTISGTGFDPNSIMNIYNDVLSKANGTVSAAGAVNVNLSKVSDKSANGAFNVRYNVEVSGINNADNSAITLATACDGGMVCTLSNQVTNGDKMTATLTVTGNYNTSVCKEYSVKVVANYSSNNEPRNIILTKASKDVVSTTAQRFLLFKKGGLNATSAGDTLKPDTVACSGCQTGGTFTCVNGTSSQSITEGVDTATNKVSWDTCIVDKTDPAGNSYNIYKSNDNPFCSMSCKEDYDFKLPGGQKNVKQGRYFEFNVDGITHGVVGISGTRTCVSSKINIALFKSQYNAAVEAAVNAYNNYSYNHVMSSQNISFIDDDSPISYTIEPNVTILDNGLTIDRTFYDQEIITIIKKGTINPVTYPTLQFNPGNNYYTVSSSTNSSNNVSITGSRDSYSYNITKNNDNDVFETNAISYQLINKSYLRTVGYDTGTKTCTCTVEGKPFLNTDKNTCNSNGGDYACKAKTEQTNVTYTVYFSNIDEIIKNISGHYKDEAERYLTEYNTQVAIIADLGVKINACSYWNNDYSFNPDIYFKYDESYTSYLTTKPLVKATDYQIDTKVTYCANDPGSTDAAVSTCTDTNGQDTVLNYPSTIKDDGTISTDTIKFKNVARIVAVAKTVNTSNEGASNMVYYKSQVPFYSITADGTVTTNKDTTNATIIANDGLVFPVELKTNVGTHNYYLTFKDIGQYENTRTLGRIMGDKGYFTGTKENPYVCTYDVCAIDDPSCGKTPNVCQNILNTAVCKLDSNTTADDYQQCIKTLLAQSDCCDTVDQYINQASNDENIKFATGKNLENSNNYNNVCPRGKNCTGFKIISQEASASTDTAVVDKTGNLNFDARTASLINLFPNGDNSNSNWDINYSSEATTAIQNIQSLGDAAYAEQYKEYEYVLSSSCMAKIREYNQQQETYDLGYADYTGYIKNSGKESYSNFLKELEDYGCVTVKTK